MVAGGSGSGTVGGDAEKIGGGILAVELALLDAIGGFAATNRGCLVLRFGSIGLS